MVIALAVAMNDQSPVQSIECRTADQFLDSLSPRGKYFREERSPDSYVFRGYADQRYKLVPAALRLGERIYTSAGWREVGCWNNEEQIRAELWTIERFFRMADSNGLPLPEDSQGLRDLLFDLQYDPKAQKGPNGYSVWPPKELLSLIALAQDYGLPTRLLDWTRRAFTAAYFAAIEAAKWKAQPNEAPSGVKSLAVWAFKAAAYDLNRIASQGLQARIAKIREITLVTAPAASNPNLRAQMGVFTLRRKEQVALGAPADREPMDCVVRNLKAQNDINNRLIEFSLPICEAPKLLRLLARERIEAATLLPGYGGVAQTVREQQYWD